MNIHKRIISDCAYAVYPSAIFNVLDQIIGASLTVYTSSILAKFADAVFERDITYGMTNFSILIVCVLAVLVVVPFFGTLKEIFLFDNSLKHNSMIYGRYLNKRFNEAQRFTEGEIQYRLEQDAIDLRCMWLDLVSKCIATPVMLGYLLFHSIQISLLYTVIIIIVTAIKLIVPIVTKRMNTKYDKELREYHSLVRSCEFEVLEQPHKVKMFGLTSSFLEKFNQIYLAFFRNTFKKSVILESVVFNISSTLDTICAIVILLFGSILVAMGDMTAGGIAAAFGFLSVFNTLFLNISSVIRDFPILGTLIDRLAIFYTHEDSMCGTSVSFSKTIVANKLSFSYEDKTVLNCLNFKICAGEKVAICGQNGSGKSTLIKILSGLIKDYSGHLEIDGYELSEAASSYWYKNVAYIEQDPYLFPVSIQENIHIGNLKATEKEIADVVRKLEMEHLISREFSTEKHTLSGGEKQKVSIARALLKDAPILIMDEPNNDLDEKALIWLKSFIELSSKTIIFVTHDKSLLSCADYIIQL